MAEYCVPVWLNRIHIEKFNIEVNQTMRIVSSTIIWTPVSWLSIPSNIAQPDIRRVTALAVAYQKSCYCPLIRTPLEMEVNTTQKSHGRQDVYQQWNRTSFKHPTLLTISLDPSSHAPHGKKWTIYAQDMVIVPTVCRDGAALKTHNAIVNHWDKPSATSCQKT